MTCPLVATRLLVILLIPLLIEPSDVYMQLLHCFAAGFVMCVQQIRFLCGLPEKRVQLINKMSCRLCDFLFFHVLASER